MKIKLIFLLVALSVCCACENDSVNRATSNNLHGVYLVRHAEKLTGKDPSLTNAGKERAETLAQFMSDKELTHIHSTNYKRTLETAAPVAAQTDIEIQIYDPSNLETFAGVLQSTPGIHLVVGHSNTTPQLARALGADPGSEIDEQSEYDRLYVIHLSPGVPTNNIERYGVRYQKGVQENKN